MGVGCGDSRLDVKDVLFNEGNVSLDWLIRSGARNDEVQFRKALHYFETDSSFNSEKS